MTEQLFDVVAVNLKDYTVRVFDRNKNIGNAEAIINMAVMRRGVDAEFYTKTEPGKYNDEDSYFPTNESN